MSPEVTTRKQYWGNFETKRAEVSGTKTMSNEKTPDDEVDDKGKTVLNKIGSDINVVDQYLKQDTNIAGVPGENPKQNPQAKQINPRVDVSKMQPPKALSKNASDRYALPGLRKYPLNSYKDVENAVDYFSKYAKAFAPIHRREFCVNLEKRASQLGIKTSPLIEKYASTTYAPDSEIEAALDIRRNQIKDPSHLTVLNKLAEQRPFIKPDVFAEALGEFDKLAGIAYLDDDELLDSYFSTYGRARPGDMDTVYVLGNDIISDKQLISLSKTPCEGIRRMFGNEFWENFKKDPLQSFNKLTVDQKKEIIRWYQTSVSI